MSTMLLVQGAFCRGWAWDETAPAGASCRSSSRDSRPTQLGSDGGWPWRPERRCRDCDSPPEKLLKPSTSTLIGNTAARGTAWHYRADHHGEESNNSLWGCSPSGQPSSNITNLGQQRVRSHADWGAASGAGSRRVIAARRGATPSVGRTSAPGSWESEMQWSKKFGIGAGSVCCCARCRPCSRGSSTTGWSRPTRPTRYPIVAGRGRRLRHRHGRQHDRGRWQLHAGAAARAAPRLARTNIFAFDTTSGAVSNTFLPKIRERVWDVIPAGDGESVYVGGQFTNVSGAAADQPGRADQRQHRSGHLDVPARLASTTTSPTCSWPTAGSTSAATSRTSAGSRTSAWWRWTPPPVPLTDHIDQITFADVFRDSPDPVDPVGQPGRRGSSGSR